MSSRRGRRAASALVAGLLGMATLVASVVLGSALSTATAAPAAPVAGLTLALTEIGPAALTPDATLRVRGRLSNLGGGSELGAVTVRLRVNRDSRLTRRADLQLWSQQDAAQAPGVVVDRVPLEPVDDGQAADFALEVPAAALGLPRTAAAFGPYGIVVDVVTGGAGAGDTRTARAAAPGTVITGVTTSVVWRPVKEYRPTPLSIVLPVLRDRPTTDARMIEPAIEAQFAPGGRLSRLVQAGADQRVAWSVDTSLLAAADRGIVVAAPTEAPTPSATGTDRPTATPTTTPTPTGSPTSTPTGTTTSATTATSTTGTGTTTGSGTADGAATAPVAHRSTDARTWLDAVRAGSTGRAVYLQPWGDPDLAALAAAGDTALLEQADRWAHDTARDVLGVGGHFEVALPAPGGVNGRTAQLAARTGRTALIVRDRDRRVTDAPDFTLGAAFPLATGGRDLTGLASDSVLSSALQRSARLADPAQAIARQRLLAELAGITLERPSDPRHQLAVLPRAWDPDPAAFARTVAALDAADWVDVTDVPTLLRSPVRTDLTTRLRPARSTSRSPVTTPLPSMHVRISSRDLTALHDLGTVLDRPAPLVEPLSSRAVSIVGATWRRSSDEELAQARAPLTTTVTTLRSGTRVLPGGPYNVLASSGDLPVTLGNDLPYGVRAVLRVSPQYGFIRMKDAIPVALDANAGAVPIKIPFRGISNGNVPVFLWLETENGVRLSPVTTLEIRVRRNWESRGMIAAVAGLLVLFVLGLMRSMRKGRGRRLAPDEQPPDVDQLLAARERRELDDAEEQDRAAPPAHRHAADPHPSANLRPTPEPDRPTEGTGPEGTAEGTAEGTGPELPASVAGGEALIRSSLVMAAGTASSRLLGFVRSSLLALAIGTGTLSADAFSTANKVPNIVYLLIAGGVLNAVLVPQIARAARDGERGRVYIDRLLSVALVTLVVTTVVVTLGAPLLMRLYSDDVTDVQLQLATLFAFWCLPQVFFYGLYTLLGQVLNARGHFGAYMWAPALNNLVAIAGIVVFIVTAGFPAAREEDTWWTGGNVLLLAGTATLGVVAQALVLVPVLRRSGFRWRFRWGLRGSGMGGASRIALWTFGAVLIAQLAFIVTSRVITAAGHDSRELYGGSPRLDQIASGSANYDYAFLLFMLPHSLITVSLVTALFTRLSHSAGAGDTGAVRDDLSLGLRITGTAMAGATAALLACAPLFTAAVHWNVGVAYGAMAMSLGLVAFSAQYLFQRVFYAFEDARTPFFIQLPVAAVTVAGALMSRAVLDPRYVLVGIGVTMTLGSLLAVAVSVVVLRGRLGHLDGGRVVRVHLRLAAAACVAGLTGWAAGRLTVRVLGAGDRGPVGTAAAAAGLLVSAVLVLFLYGLLLRLFRVEELGYVLGPFRRILRRLGFGGGGSSGPTPPATPEPPPAGSPPRDDVTVGR